MLYKSYLLWNVHAFLMQKHMYFNFPMGHCIHTTVFVSDDVPFPVYMQWFLHA